MAREWLYGNAWERFPIEKGQTWTLGPLQSMVAVHNIFDTLPPFMTDADLLFVDPPWNLGNINSFYTKACMDSYINHFDLFVNVLFDRINEIHPQTCYLEIGKQHKNDFKRRLKLLYEVVQEWPVTYYKKHPCFILRGSSCKTNLDFTSKDEADCITQITAIEEYNTIGDLCIGRGLVGIAAYHAMKRFVGTELNKRRLACLLAAIADSGGMVECYDRTTSIAF